MEATVLADVVADSDAHVTSMATDPTAETVTNIKWVAYSIIAYIIVSLGIVGNLLNLVVLTRPNLKGVMYVYLLGLAVSNLCVLVTAIPALFDISKGLGGGDYTTAFYQAHLELPLINSFMASSVYIIICMTVNRYISIYKPTQFQRIHTFKNARLSIAASFLGGILLHIPLCFQNEVSYDCENEDNSTLPVNITTTSSCVWKSNENFQISENLLFKIYLVVSEILLRVGPIIILATLNALIIHKFLKIAKKRQVLKGASNSKYAPGRQHRLSPPSSPYPSNGISSSTGASSSTAASSSTQCSSSGPVSFASVGGHLAPAPPCIQYADPSSSATPTRCISPVRFSQQLPSRSTSPTPNQPCLTPNSTPGRFSRRRSLQNPEERVLVLVLISIVVLFVCCCTPAAILSILYSVKLDHHLGFQIFRACANNLELLNFALNFYIYCLCSAEIRRAFVNVFRVICACCSRKRRNESVSVRVDQV